MLFIYQIHTFATNNKVKMAKEWKYKLKNEKNKTVSKEFDSWSREDLIEYVVELRRGMDEMLEVSRKEYEKSPAVVEKLYLETDYKQTWSYPTKIAFLLTLNQKPMTSEELDALLLKMDSHYKDYNSPRNNLTVTLGRAVKSGRIRKIKVPGIRSLYYVLPEWVDKEGNINAKFSSAFNQFE